MLFDTGRCGRLSLDNADVIGGWSIYVTKKSLKIEVDTNKFNRRGRCECMLILTGARPGLGIEAMASTIVVIAMILSFLLHLDRLYWHQN
jgi:hypothetical protein